MPLPIATVAQHLDFKAVILYIDTRSQGNHNGGNLLGAGSRQFSVA